MIVELLEDDPQFKIKKGDRFRATPYWLDPQEKVTLLERVSDGYKPNCNQYRYCIRIVTQKELLDAR
jgi:hypothetical protein